MTAPCQICEQLVAEAALALLHYGPLITQAQLVAVGGDGHVAVVLLAKLREARKSLDAELLALADHAESHAVAFEPAAKPLREVTA
jgi:hypothetical protein